MLRIPILLSATMTGRNRMNVEAVTAVVNAHGGLLEAGVDLVPGQKIRLSNLKTEVVGRWKVLRAPRLSGAAAFQSRLSLSHRLPDSGLSVSHRKTGHPLLAKQLSPIPFRFPIGSQRMDIARRLCELRERTSQGDGQPKTGLLRGYISPLKKP